MCHFDRREKSCNSLLRMVLLKQDFFLRSK